MKILFRKFLTFLFKISKKYIRDHFEFPQIHKDLDSEIIIGENVKFGKCLIKVMRNSRLKIGNDCYIDGILEVDNSSNLIIERNSKINGGIITVINNGTAVLQDGFIMSKSYENNSRILVDSGNLFFGKKVKSHAQRIHVLMNGNLHVGELTGISYGTEIVCADTVRIGNFCLISYDVCIYDTNSHSLDWLERRERINKCYPRGVFEIEKPGTKAVFIGNDVWIGKGATITKGAYIGDKCIIGIRTNVGGIKLEGGSVCVAGEPRVLQGKLKNYKDH